MVAVMDNNEGSKVEALERWPLDQLSTYDGNPRTHSEEQVRQIMASITEFGFTNPILIADGEILAGHGRYEAAKRLELSTVPVIRLDHLSPIQRRAYVIADNQIALNADWDQELLKNEISYLVDYDFDFDVDMLGFEEEELESLLGVGEPNKGEILEDDVPEPPADPVTQPGDLWVLGDHRLLCGDSTKADDVARLMGGTTAVLLHADPPYGMGKESEGVQNDNLYGEKLDQFQMDWWLTFRPHLADNASAYIWGNAPDLWRLWYCGGLSESERMTIRNEIVWDKGSAGAGGISHIGAEGLRLFPQSTERCLFFMLGEQGFNNNADNYWEGFEPIRKYLDGERQKCNWNNKNVAEFFGFHPRMADHWFSKSQWSFPTREQYQRLQHEANGDAFKREHDELKQEYDELKQAFYATRAYFDNTHDNMTDVWGFPRVTGEDRHGHATPKPVAMIATALLSSSPPDSLVIEPFLGSGTTLIAAEQTGRNCYGMEISPAYCDVIVKRWENLTGNTATKELSNG